jgi:hypothetical protein
MVIERFSSRRAALGDVLTARLAGASRYLRIAGYFRSSLLEAVGEALESVSEIRVVCNGDLDPYDVKVAKAAREANRRWRRHSYLRGSRLKTGSTCCSRGSDTAACMTFSHPTA